MDSNDDLIDYQFALNMFASSLTKAVPRFVQFTKQIDEQDFVDHLGEKEEMIAKEKKAKSLIDKYLQEKNMNIEKLKPVSYTHLDVYKRQDPCPGGGSYN